jgi:two-component SAPR family response regulator
MLVASNLSGFIKYYLIIAQGNLAIAQADTEEVSHILKKNRKILKASQSAYERGLWLYLEGRCFLLKGNAKKAIVLFKECRDLFLKDGRDIEWQLSIIWLSASFCQENDLESAVEAIKEVLTDNINFDHALIVAVKDAIPWLDDLKSDPIIGRKLVGLIKRASGIKNKMPVIRRNLRRHTNFIKLPSANLVIRAFGNPEISVNDRVIQMSDWRTQSVRDLFLYFVQNQEAITKEQIGAVLWPETENLQALRARFKNEIYRLRKAAGRDVIVFEDEYYRFNHQMDYEYDVEAFDSHISRARKTRDISNRIDHLRKAVDLVHGPYLADIDAEWAVSERGRLWLAYGSALEELAYLYLDTGKIENCLSICQLALKRDRYHEAIYQIEMRAHAVIGDRSAIMRRYQACKAAIGELGIPLSVKTKNIFHELTS